MPKKIPAKPSETKYLIEYIDAAYLYKYEIDRMDGMIGVPPTLNTIATDIYRDDELGTYTLSAGSTDKTLVPPSKSYRYIMPIEVVRSVQEITIKAGKAIVSEDLSSEFVNPVDIKGVQKKATLLFKDLTPGNSVSITWRDVRLTSGVSKIITLVPMYLEGTYLGIHNGFVYVHNPENLNVEKVKNHPMMKADLYAVPLEIVVSASYIGANVKHIPEYEFIAGLLAKDPKKEIEISAKKTSIGTICGFTSKDERNTGLYATRTGTKVNDKIIDLK